MTISLTIPVEVTDSSLTYSDIPEPDTSLGEESWQDEAARTVYGDFVLPAGYGRLHHIMQNDYGEFYLIVQAFPGTDYKITKYDEDRNILYSFGDFADIISVDPDSEPRGIANNDTTVYVFWRTTAKAIYRQIITEIGAEGGSPLTYTTTTVLMNNAPTLLKEAKDSFFTVSSGNILALFSDNYSGDDYSEVMLYRLNQTGSLVSSIGTGVFSGNAQYLSSNRDGGVIATIKTEYSTEQTDFIEYNVDLVPNHLGSVKFSKYPNNPNRITSYFNGVITWIENSKLSAVINAEFTVLSRSLINAGSYKLGDEVIRDSSHRKYRCLVDETFSDPLLTTTGDALAEWIDIGPTNKWAMFDGKVKNKTKSTTDFTLDVVSSAIFDNVSFFGVVVVESIRVEVIYGGETIYDETKGFIDLSSIVDHYSYAFYQLIFANDGIFKDIPPYIGSTIRVTFTGTGSGIEVGAMLFGMSKSMGVTCINTKSNTIDYSDVEYDVFGELSEVERPVVSYNTYEIDIPKPLAQSVERRLRSSRGVDCVWVGDIGDNQDLITYGRYERSPVTYSNPSVVSYSVKVRGSI